MSSSMQRSKGISNSKCDLGIWILSKSWDFLGIFLDFWQISGLFLGYVGIWGGFLGDFLGILWEIFGNSLGILGNSWWMLEEFFGSSWIFEYERNWCFCQDFGVMQKKEEGKFIAQKFSKETLLTVVFCFTYQRSQFRL